MNIVKFKNMIIFELSMTLMLQACEKNVLECEFGYEFLVTSF